MKQEHTPLFDKITTAGIAACERASQIEEKSFLNPKWKEAYNDFCEATAYQDTRVDKFATYVKYYAGTRTKLANSSHPHVKIESHGTNQKWYHFTNTRMMNGHDVMTKVASFKDLHKDLLGDLYYAD